MDASTPSRLKKRLPLGIARVLVGAARSVKATLIGNGRTEREMAAAVDREMLPVDARFQSAVHGVQEIVAVRLDVEADQIGAQHAVEQFALPGADRRRPPGSARECARKWRRARPAALP